MERLKSIQMLRGIAAMLVVFHHFMQQFYNFEKTNVIGDFFSYYGKFGVDIFFVLSGFIMGYTLLSKNKSASEFLKGRIYRILPPYYFFTLVILVFGMIFEGIHSSSASLETVFKSLLFIPHENPDINIGVYPTLTVGWTLNLEMFFYITLYLLLLTPLKALNKLLFTCCLFIGLPILYIALNFNIYVSVAGNLRLSEFSFGILIAILFVYNIKLFKSFWLTSPAVLLLLIVCFIEMPTIICDVFISSLIVYFSLLIGMKTNYSNRYLEYLGKISYSIYLTHSVVILSIWLISPELSTHFNVMIALLLTVLITIAISHASYEYIEIRFSRFLTKITFDDFSAIKPRRNLNK